MKNKLIRNISRILMCALLINVIPTKISLAAEMSVTDQNRLLGAVPNEWESANLREWLNSEGTVNYTALPPSYKDESGFLSTSNFTTSEKDAIAVTRHGGAWQYSISNTNDTKYVSQRSVAHNDYIYNDKVFVLNYTDLVNYIERNKQLMNLNMKYYSNYLKSTTNKQDKYPYLVNSGYVNGGYAGTNQIYSSTLTALTGRNPNNIVPALSLKPTYVFPNGTKASDLQLGQVINFGKYNGEAIEWQVINISDSGYPLLWSTKIIMMKEYDTQGDLNPTKSNFVNFPTYEVDIASGTGQNKSWENKSSIKSFPVITITNESVLTTPTNDTELTINIKVTDVNNTIRNITLPDGRVVSGDTATYTVPKNGEFDIITENSQGVITVRHIVTKAINTPAEVTITTDKDNSTKWSNRPVNVTVAATNNGIYTKTTGSKTTGYGGVSTSAFPLWMPLNGKRVRMTGTIYNRITDEDIVKYGLDMNAIIRFRINYTQYSVSTLSPNYPIVKNISLAQLKEAGEIVIDEIFTLPTNVYGNLTLSANLMDNNSPYMKTGYNWGTTAITYEILDKDDLKIEEISLPDGNVVYADRATYTIYKNGSYTFSAKDNRNKTTSKTIDLAIDTIKPTLDIISSETKLTKELTLSINANDDLSGIKSIKLPNGEYRTTNSEGQGLSIQYNIIKNGNYTFETTDYAGNVTQKTVSITNVDNTPPELNLTYNSNFTNSSIVVNVTATDGESGVKQIVLPNGNIINGTSTSYIINDNGIYYFSAIDNNGNVTLKSVTINNIDKKIPTVTINNNTNWTNQNVLITITAKDE